MSIQKYDDFINESGIQGIKKQIQGYKEAEIYFHQDADGVMSALAMKVYLERYGVKTINAHIIQYGGLNYAIKHTKKGALPVLVDFAHSKPMFKIHTDHHDSQAGVVTKATSFKSARSNAETLSAEVSPSDIFTATDIELIQTVDSADFLAKGIKPEDVSNSIFKLDRSKGAQENRFMMGFVVNRLLLAYKNKEITGTSLDGKNKYKDENFLVCLLRDSNASLHSMFNNIKHYINNFTAITWSNRQYRNLALATPETLLQNLNIYQNKMKDYKDLKVDSKYNVAVQYAGGSLFNPGAYDRYTVFKNYPEINFYSIVWPLGLIQLSCNPFKEKKLKGIHLGDLAKEVMEPYKFLMKRIKISVADVKKEAESDMEKIDTKFTKQSRDFDQRVGFKFDDLKAFYGKNIFKFEKVDGKWKETNINLDKDDAKKVADELIEEKNSKAEKARERGDERTATEAEAEAAEIKRDAEEAAVSLVKLKEIINKKHSDLTYDEKKFLFFYRIDSWELIMGNSGGHPSITNLQGWNYMKYASKKGKQVLKERFGSDNYTMIMKKIQSELINRLKSDIDKHEEIGVGVTADSKDDAVGGLSYD